MKFVIETDREGYRAFCDENPSICFLGRTQEEALGEAIKGNRERLNDSGVFIDFKSARSWMSVIWPTRLRFRVDPEKQLLIEIKKIIYEKWLLEPPADLFHEIKKAVEATYGPVFQIDDTGRSATHVKPR